MHPFQCPSKIDWYKLWEKNNNLVQFHHLLHKTRVENKRQKQTEIKLEKQKSNINRNEEIYIYQEMFNFNGLI